MEKIKLGQTIKKYRIKKGITIRELSQTTSISTGFIGDIEANRSRPSYENLVKLVQALDIPIEDIFTTNK
ncbi:helix-turn-helix domain-containing protein [Sporanaerobacter acetigenes]|uniref:DNA-binding transcriptional regulator, XRE-family HTH domain n=1 Tax=Sporanaerobacter acetigenes DSM 13106 TaxID=1123281 RepID=A0A1M5XQ73_9FIRM|nr:helix-turn-helix transcriptional regulator [Sporanaerobacter acetigenes]SHI01906.1 DNA-binding transcriptional regulator, XRE-family HTH domain [Sporanaerobacter acetigenes DSM 13106]